MRNPLGTLTAIAALSASAAAQDVGSPLPDLELPTIQRDRTLRLSELRGKRVLLIEFASW